MTPKEIVHRAIDRRGPARVPVTYCNRDLELSDTARVSFKAAAGFAPARPKLTEWGYEWETLDGTMGQPHDHPLADLANLSSYVPPDPNAPGRLEHIPGWIEQHPGKFLVFGLGITGFNQATFLRGYEAYLQDLYEDLSAAEKVADIVFDFENAMIERVAPLPFDAIGFADDWGTQRCLMIAPDLWRKVFKPRYARQFARCREAGKKVWFHSCGNLHAVIEDMIEIGADVLEFLQPDVFGVERLGREFGGRVCFCCSIDHQRRAVSGTRDEIFAYARRLNDRLGRFNGGFIAYIEDYACLGMPEQNYQWIRQAFHGLAGPAPQARVMRKGECPSEKYATTDIHWLVSGAANGAREITMGETTLDVGGRNPLHRHPNCEESLYVLAGQIEHVIEGQPNVRMSAGEAILVPRNLKHQAINIGSTPARLLVAFSSPERQTAVEPS